MARSVNVVTRKRLFLKRSEVEDLLGQTVCNDAIAHGWLKPKTIKKGKKRENAMILFSAADVSKVEDRLNSGEYPGQ
jgi:hypothetical protein